MSLLLLLDTGTAGYVVSFPTVAPRPRHDQVTWTTILVEEAPAKDGPWTERARADIAPLDEDPANPSERDITLRGAQLEAGWYRITFLDAAGNSSAIPAIYRGDSWTPTVAQVGALLRARTADHAGVELGTFTPDTRPTGSEAGRLIDAAVQEIAAQIGNDPAAKVAADRRDDVRGMANHAAALRAAVLIETSYFPEQVGAGASGFLQHRGLSDELIAAIKSLQWSPTFLA